MLVVFVMVGIASVAAITAMVVCFRRRLRHSSGLCFLLVPLVLCFSLTKALTPSIARTRIFGLENPDVQMWPRVLFLHSCSFIHSTRFEQTRVCVARALCYTLGDTGVESGPSKSAQHGREDRMRVHHHHQRGWSSDRGEGPGCRRACIATWLGATETFTGGSVVCDCSTGAGPDCHVPPQFHSSPLCDLWSVTRLLCASVSPSAKEGMSRSCLIDGPDE